MSGLIYEIEKKTLDNGMKYSLLLELEDYSQDTKNTTDTKITFGPDEKANAILSLYNETKGKKIKTWLVRVGLDIPLAKMKISKFPKEIYYYWKNNKFLDED